jgi:signal transduction histidine kinase
VTTRLRDRISTRTRIALAASLVLAAVLGASAVAIYVAYVHNQERAVERAAHADAKAISSLGATKPLPARLPPLPSGPFTLVQVLDPHGGIVSQSPGLTKHAPVIGRSLLGRAASIEGDDRPLGGGGKETKVTTVPVQLASGRATVAVIVSTVDNQRARDTLTLVLLIGMPALVLLGGLFIWMAIGRALRPVENMRKQAAAISASDLHLRVPQPPGDDPISDLAITLNAMLDRLEQSNVDQRRFIGDASHELRSPVTNTYVALEVARDLAEDPDERALFETLLKEQRRVVTLVEQLLLLARLDAPPAQFPEHEVDLSGLISSEVDLSGDDVPNMRAEIAENVYVAGDPELLARIVRNLLNNARRYAKSSVVVTLAAVDGWARLAVSDDGPGIPVRDRQRIFDRFVRLDDSRGRDSGGTGLGLSIVYEAVTTHRGTTTITDGELGRGTTVIVELPLIADEPPS